MKPAILSAITGLLALCPLAQARTFSLPSKGAAPGNEIAFPVAFDNASGCASIQIQLNYDNQILDFVRFDTGAGLGSQFEPTVFAENGVLTLIWTRSTGLVSGSGTLGHVTFRVNAGAKPGQATPLAISNFETSDETGVIEYALVDSIQAVSGALIVSSVESDTDDDGIPDSWEIANTLNPEISNFNADSDHDGRTDFLEYAFGGNPRGLDPNRSPAGGSVLVSTVPYFSLSFDRRQSSLLVYRVMESSALGAWSEVTLGERQIGPALDHGDGTERVTVRSSFKMNGAAASPKGFMKVEVEKR